MADKSYITFSKSGNRQVVSRRFNPKAMLIIDRHFPYYQVNMSRPVFIATFRSFLERPEWPDEGSRAS